MTSQEEFKLRCEILDRYGEDSEEYRAHRRRAAAAAEQLEFGGKVLAAAGFALLILAQLYFTGNLSSGYGRVDAHDWMELNR